MFICGKVSLLSTKLYVCTSYIYPPTKIISYILCGRLTTSKVYGMYLKTKLRNGGKIVSMRVFNSDTTWRGLCHLYLYLRSMFCSSARYSDYIKSGNGRDLWAFMFKALIVLRESRRFRGEACDSSR